MISGRNHDRSDVSPPARTAVPPTMTGRSGSTQGASTVSTPAANETIVSASIARLQPEARRRRLRRSARRSATWSAAFCARLVDRHESRLQRHRRTSGADPAASRSRPSGSSRRPERPLAMMSSSSARHCGHHGAWKKSTAVPSAAASAASVSPRAPGGGRRWRTASTASRGCRGASAGRDRLG